MGEESMALTSLVWSHGIQSVPCTIELFVFQTEDTIGVKRQ